MTRHEARACAFQALYSHSYSPQSEPMIWHAGCNAADGEGYLKAVELSGFTGQLIAGACAHESELNAIVEKYARNRNLERIGRLEQILLRLALYEIIYLGEFPQVVMSECMALADEFGADMAKSFVNGILDAAARDMPRCSAGEDICRPAAAKMRKRRDENKKLRPDNKCN